MLLGTAALARVRRSGSLPTNGRVVAAVLFLLGMGVTVLVSVDILPLVTTALVSAVAAAFSSRTRFQRLNDSPRMHWMDSLPLVWTTRLLHLRIQAAVPVVFIMLGMLAVMPFDLLSAVTLATSLALTVLLVLLLPLRSDAAATRHHDIESPGRRRRPSRVLLH
jgi:hypothetical protein